MALKRVIPCLDVDAGRVVKGTNFVDLRDAGDPVELAERYDAEGADELVFLDITASHEKRDTITELARRTADNVFIPFMIGGGIRSVADAQAVLDAGADKVAVNSSALADPDLISELAVGLRLAVRRRSRSTPRACASPPPLRVRATRSRQYDVYINGGRTLVEGREAVAWAREATERGAGEVLLTSMDRDGTTDGYDLELTRAVADAVAVPVIASGGVGELDHLVAGVTEGGADAVLAASIFHYGKFTRRRGEAGDERGRDRGPRDRRLTGRPSVQRRLALRFSLSFFAGSSPSPSPWSSCRRRPCVAVSWRFALRLLRRLLALALLAVRLLAGGGARPAGAAPRDGARPPSRARTPGHRTRPVRYM